MNKNKKWQRSLTFRSSSSLRSAKSGFFARKALRDGLFLKWAQIGIFPDFEEKCGKIGEKNRETAIHRRIELPTDENLFLRCYKWMYFPSTGTAFSR